MAKPAYKKKDNEKEELLKVQKKTSGLITTYKHNEDIRKMAKTSSGFIKGIPIFYDDSLPGSADALIDFHNKLNRNLFQRKNLKVLKQLYETKSTDATRKPETERNLFLTEEKTDFLLEQRANAFQTTTSALGIIQKKMPLHPKLKLDFTKGPNKVEKPKNTFRISSERRKTPRGFSQKMDSTHDFKQTFDQLSLVQPNKSEINKSVSNSGMNMRRGKPSNLQVANTHRTEDRVILQLTPQDLKVLIE